MLSIRHILFPVDFSDRSYATVPYVAAKARDFGAKVSMLAVVRPVILTGMEAASAAFVDPEELRFAVQSRLDEFAPDAFEGVDLERIAVVGDPADAIIEFAHLHQTDLIMMPTHGYGPFRRLLLGSVTAKVLHDVSCPVWTDAHVEHTPAHYHLKSRAILCAVDDSPRALEVMKWAAELSRHMGAKLHMVHVVPGTGTFLEAELGVEVELSMRDRMEKKLDDIRKRAGIETTIHVAAGEVADRVRAEAERFNSDLLVIGRGVLHEKLGRLRTHAHSIIRHAPCPVISI